MNMQCSPAPENVRIGQGTLFLREVNTIIAALIIATVTYIFAFWVAPQIAEQNINELVPKFVGVAWPFFALVLALVFYVVGATIVAAFALGAPRQWSGISQALYWATEACPLVGLLTTFLSLLIALLAYGEAGPGQPETQAAFITQFAIAFGSSIAGGVLALMAFTLHRLLPKEGL